MAEDFKFYCKICGKELVDDVLEYGMICNECFEKNCTEEVALEVGRYINYYEGEEKISINDFLLSVYTDDEIEEILLNDFNKLPENKKSEYVLQYLKEKDFEIADVLKTPENKKKW